MRVRRPPFKALAALVLFLLWHPAPALALDEAELWRALKSGGHVAIMRHALAPGTGDPGNFALRDCATQRNLSQEGRDQSARIGERFRANGIAAAKVFSSQWCRCLETARLLGLGELEELPSLNSFFQAWEKRDGQTRALRDWLRQQDLARPTVLVTHQVNITALTGVFPSSGEIVFLRRDEAGELLVIGTIETD